MRVMGLVWLVVSVIPVFQATHHIDILEKIYKVQFALIQSSEWWADSVQSSLFEGSSDGESKT